VQPEAVLGTFIHGQVGMVGKESRLLGRRRGSDLRVGGTNRILDQRL
jgi:hypothetical protein